MVRVFLKGGVWKNSEDEILKAAVQKYGKQQWARVASLLNRKTAKQAKARWHEWLDPAIRKTEWSRQEEEKLLHLAKLMPAQWKTIAPLVGRTATQCQEHYEYLLDQAAGVGSGGEAGGAAAGGDGTSSTEQSIRNAALRPGQIDAHPETRPAKPDPIDMDEDEMEMLQEARARLANTVGKKAKRKQREKMLAQAKRLADLQKRRELKQAGLLSKQAKKAQKAKAKREIDLGVEIPFHKPAPAGFHDVSGEDAKAESIRQKRLKDVDFQKVNENQYRTRDREAAAARKREEARLRILEQSNEKYASAAAAAKKEEEEILVRPRGTLNLPAPTVSDNELSQLAKIQQQQGSSAAESADSLGGPAATQALLGDYSDRPLPTPMRTPAAAASASASSRQQDLMKSAQQLRKLERGTTPLLGPGGHEQQPEEEDSDDDNRKVPAAMAGQTPQLPGGRGDGNKTPGTVIGTAATAPRDELGLNRSTTELTTATGGDDLASVGARTFDTSKYSIRELARQERRAAKRARQELEKALAALPAPQFEIELAAPAAVTDDDDEDGRVETVSVEDRADVEAAELEQQRLEAEKIYEARSSVLKRSDLTRPTGIGKDIDALLLAAEADGRGDIDKKSVAARSLIQEEMLTLIRHDNYAFPVSIGDSGSSTKDANGKKKKNKKKRKQDEISPIELDILPEDALDSAKEMIDAELRSLMDEKVAGAIGAGLATTPDLARGMLIRSTCNASRDSASGLVFSDKNGWQRSGDKSSKPTSAVDAFRTEFETLQEATQTMKKKNDKLENKLTVLNGGYVKRARKIRDDLHQAFADLQNSKIEESVYRMLQEHEVKGAAERIRRLQDDVDSLKNTEAALQKRYGELVVEKRRLVVMAKSAEK